MLDCYRYILEAIQVSGTLESKAKTTLVTRLHSSLGLLGRLWLLFMVKSLQAFLIFDPDANA